MVRFSPATAGLFFGWLMTRRRRHQHSCAWAASVAHPNVQSASALARQDGAGLRMATGAPTATAGMNAWMSSNCATHDAREHGITRAWRTQAACRRQVVRLARGVAQTIDFGQDIWRTVSAAQLSCSVPKARGARARRLAGRCLSAGVPNRGCRPLCPSAWPRRQS